MRRMLVVKTVVKMTVTTVAMRSAEIWAKRREAKVGLPGKWRARTTTRRRERRARQQSRSQRILILPSTASPLRPPPLRRSNSAP